MRDYKKEHEKRQSRKKRLVLEVERNRFEQLTEYQRKALMKVLNNELHRYLFMVEVYRARGDAGISMGSI